jgi:hypothetical protein
VVYRVARQKKETSEAVFDPVLCPDPVAFLTQRLGKLASCKIVLPAEQTSPPTLPPLLAQAVSRVGGVLPLVAEWLVATMPDLFTSERSAKRQLAGVFTSPLPSGRRLAVYSRPGRSRPSQALICDDVSDPRATLERLLGTELRTFRPFDAPGPGPEANGHSAAPSGPGPEAPSLDGVVLGMAGRSLNGLFRHRRSQRQSWSCGAHPPAGEIGIALICRFHSRSPPGGRHFSRTIPTRLSPC